MLTHSSPRSCGLHDPHGHFQQLRLFDSALTDKQILDIASNSTDPITKKVLRTCILPTATDSSSYQDRQGNNCEWYFTARTEDPHACNEAASLACPIACERSKCYKRASKQPARHHIWDRIHRLIPQSGKHTLCLDTSISKKELLSECKLPPQAGTHQSSHVQEPRHGFPYFSEKLRDESYLNVTDCEVLRASLNEYCSFSFPRSAHTIDPEQFTISFWIKHLSNRGTHEMVMFIASCATWLMRILILSVSQVSLYSGLNPPELFFTLKGPSTDKYQTTWLIAPNGTGAEDVNVHEDDAAFRMRNWVRYSLTFGPKNELNL